MGLSKSATGEAGRAWGPNLVFPKPIVLKSAFTYRWLVNKVEYVVCVVL